ncbi:3-oxoacyl-[acyl-carrier protein] reductase/2-[hydroxy(phenyl)methyl]-succinyl-CoA dehydrogenase BbsD subunit [Mesobacillus persicus]|uniref:3-oxoacyl-[acyl-carrier protein] reductase/2-[hydroxy(Phenyl)methyl]-succinyl-CoA dehydrogenase BbsD subunit n=1 Tax=Mesobacillus persicus TaxID=930146 RepID=A0A1H8D7Q1_9BACI|nr:SDR family NAD(P)-dependent oxidoreductase [Mesobacillus persicus]SEN03206.1 3-oxoacyl-[acyl-carrier protein] reductase/2-[hydroxy(phenyl)methyl]-succinyl-CoA dehydrogenase BbsD subunit [Mesobacillus persicus]
MGRLENKVALITGSAGGLGLEIATHMAKQGAKVILNDVNEDLVKQAVMELQTEYEADYVIGDVSNKDDVTRMFNQIIERFGEIHILVNNAGGSLHTPRVLGEIEEEHWDKVLNVNLKGTFLTSQAFVKHTKEKSGGKIINMSSIGGRTASLVTGVAYAAAKGGVISFSRRLAKEVGRFGINVNVIAPGLIISGERMHHLFFEENTEEQRQQVYSEIPLQSLGEKEDIANAAVFLASDESRYITGTVLDVNGGRFMG